MAARALLIAWGYRLSSVVDCFSTNVQHRAEQYCGEVIPDGRFHNFSVGGKKGLVKSSPELLFKLFSDS